MSFTYSTAKLYVCMTNMDTCWHNLTQPPLRMLQYVTYILIRFSLAWTVGHISLLLIYLLCFHISVCVCVCVCVYTGGGGSWSAVWRGNRGGWASRSPARWLPAAQERSQTYCHRCETQLRVLFYKSGKASGFGATPWISHKLVHCRFVVLLQPDRASKRGCKLL